MRRVILFCIISLLCIRAYATEPLDYSSDPAKIVIKKKLLSYDMTPKRFTKTEIVKVNNKKYTCGTNGCYVVKPEEQGKEQEEEFNTYYNSYRTPLFYRLFRHK